MKTRSGSMKKLTKKRNDKMNDDLISLKSKKDSINYSGFKSMSLDFSKKDLGLSKCSSDKRINVIPSYKERFKLNFKKDFKLINKDFIQKQENDIKEQFKNKLKKMKNQTVENVCSSSMSTFFTPTKKKETPKKESDNIIKLDECIKRVNSYLRKESILKKDKSIEIKKEDIPKKLIKNGSVKNFKKVDIPIPGLKFIISRAKKENKKENQNPNSRSQQIKKGTTPVKEVKKIRAQYNTNINEKKTISKIKTAESMKKQKRCLNVDFSQALKLNFNDIFQSKNPSSPHGSSFLNLNIGEIKKTDEDEYLALKETFRNRLAYPSVLKRNPYQSRNMNEERNKKEYEICLSKVEDPSIFLESTIVNDGTVECHDINEVS